MGIGFDDRINKNYSMDELSLELWKPVDPSRIP